MMVNLCVFYLSIIILVTQGILHPAIDISPKPVAEGYFGKSLRITTTTTFDVWDTFVYVIGGTTHFLTYYPTSTCSERPITRLVGYSFYCNVTHFVLVINTLSKGMSRTTIKGQLTLTNGSVYHTRSTKVRVNAYILLKPNHNAIPGESYDLTCKAEDIGIRFHRLKISDCIITGIAGNGSCILHEGCNYQCQYICDPINSTFTLRLPGSMDIESYQNSTWLCSDIYDVERSNPVTVFVDFPVPSINITPKHPGRLMFVESVSTKTFICKTGFGRPAPYIHWYIDEHNITNLALTQTDSKDDKFFATSKLVYRGNEADHNKSIYCEAGNIVGRKITSTKQTLYIQDSITSVRLKTENMHTHANVVILEGSTENFTCTTDSGRPAAKIHWYIGGRNVTSDSTITVTTINNRFITTSVLVYSRNYDDDNANIYCEASNIEGRTMKKSITLIMKMFVPVSSVEIFPKGKQVKVIKGETVNITCRTNSSLSNPRIYWSIGSRNVTDLVKYHLTETYDRYYNTTSVLTYTADQNDHNKYIICYVGSRENGNKAASSHIQLKVLCCDVCNNVDVDQKWAFHEAVLLGAFCMLLIIVLLFLCVYLVKRYQHRFACKDNTKVTEYEMTKTCDDEDNPYNELNNPETADKDHIRFSDYDELNSESEL